MKLGAALATLLGLGVAFAAPAQAFGPAETEFLHALDQAQIDYTTPEAAIAYGHRVCAALDDGQSGNDILPLITHDNPTVLEWQAGAFLGASITAFCPDQDGAASG